MKRYIQHGFLKISHFTAREWQHPVHNHNHFEIIFVHRGKGLHCLSGTKHAYSGKSLFLLAPCDFHHFSIEEETEFTFLKFTSVYPEGMGNHAAAQHWNEDMDQLLIQARRQHLPMLNSEAAAEKTDQLIRLIVKEWEETKNETNETIFFLIQALLSLIRRSIPAAIPAGKQKHSEKISGILNYLHHNICSAGHLQLDHLAQTFGYSKHYLGIFFKEQAGVSLRDYINQYRLHLAENRLQYSSLSVKEISNELGFTDLSHFNKFFNKQKGVSPSGFRSSATAYTVDKKRRDL
jgi:AraC-like DNA-binding protein